MQRRMLLVTAGVIAVGIGWYLFRPERLFVNQTVNEGFPAVASTRPSSMAAPAGALLEGRFHGVAHETKGTASIYQVGDGKRVIRLTQFETSNGPDVQVYLVAAGDATDSETVKKAGFIHLGALKGNQGDQNYDVPADTDLGKYRSVTIWCRRFGVNFGTAPLAAIAQRVAMAGSPVSLASGRFHSVAHESRGQATLHKLADGKRVLRLTEFETSNGPDVQVYLVAAAYATDNDTVKKVGFVSLGALKGNKGDQNYDVPEGVDLNKYRAVTIWCRRFGVNFATAPLVLQ